MNDREKELEGYIAILEKKIDILEKYIEEVKTINSALIIKDEKDFIDESFNIEEEPTQYDFEYRQNWAENEGRNIF